MKRLISGAVTVFDVLVFLMMAAALGVGPLIETSAFAASSDDVYFRDQRMAMVRDQIVRRGVRDNQVIQAMTAVPRHQFVPHRYLRSAYDDSPLPIGYGQTISQPYIVAYMTEVLHLNKSSRVLEVGTGSGYQAAVLSPIVKKVYTLEIIPELAKEATERLHQLGYDNIEVAMGDGYYGWKQHAPFDAIMVTAAAGHIPPPLLEQLKNNGRMVIPVGGAFLVQNLILIHKDQDGHITTRNLMPVRFVPLTGKRD
jgi:protein-L-isoaspartate(D-aspartate) O-methyltransferase